MIIVDTNVISEPMRPTPDLRVLAWIDRQRTEDLYFSAVNLAELMSGIERLPDGRRKHTLRTIADDMVENHFKHRILTFDAGCALKLAELYNKAVSKGYNIEFADCQIAAIAAVHGFVIATRDEAPFKAAGLPTINPWTA
jgi:predicted nucleic acid-binding protein